MTTQLSHQRPRPWMATRKAGARLGRLATVLAAVISGLLASAAAATAAFANPVPVGDGGPPPGAGPGQHRPGDQHRRHGGLADRLDRRRGRPGRRSRSRTPGPQAGRPPRRHRHHRLMRPPATARRACLTTGPGPEPSGRPAFALSQPAGP